MYRLTARARRDLKALYARGEDLFGVAQADDYASGLTRTFHFLADNPHLARERTETATRVRVYRYKAHLIVYTVEAGSILIVRVRHGHEDWLSDT